MQHEITQRKCNVASIAYRADWEIPSNGWLWDRTTKVQEEIAQREYNIGSVAYVVGSGLPQQH